MSLHGLVTHRADTYQMQSPSFRISGKDVVVARFLVFVRVLLTEHALHYTTGGIAIHPHPGVGRSDPSGEGTHTWHNMPMERESGVRPN